MCYPLARNCLLCPLQLMDVSEPVYCYSYCKLTYNGFNDLTDAATALAVVSTYVNWSLPTFVLRFSAYL